MIRARPQLHVRHRSRSDYLHLPHKLPQPSAAPHRGRPSASKDHENLLQQLKNFAAAGKGISPEDLKKLVDLQEDTSAEESAGEERSEVRDESVRSDPAAARRPGPWMDEQTNEKAMNDIPEDPGSGGQPSKKDLEVPTRMKNFLKGIGMWDLIPPDGFKVNWFSESNNKPGLWTDEEFEAMQDYNFEGTDEEELEHELTRLRAVRKLEAELGYKETDTQKIFDMGLKFRGLNEGKIYAEVEDLIDDVEPEKFVPEKEIDDFLRMEAKGERLPHVSTWDKNVMPPEDAATYLERFYLARTYIHDKKKKSKDRTLPPEKFYEIDEKWKKFSREYDAKMSNPFQEELSVSQEAPDWPEWQDEYNHTVQHIYNLLRCAYIDGATTEPPRRLKKYNYIADDVEFIVHSKVVETTGYDVYLDHMFKLRSNGVTTQPSNLFMRMSPPKGKVSKDNPFDYLIVCDYYCNVPLPKWYRDIIADIEKEREEKRAAEAAEGGWKPPFDYPAYADLWKDRTKTKIMEEMDKAIKSAAKDSKEENENIPKSLGATWEIGDDDPYPDEGPFWLKEKAKGDEWKYGKVFTINSSARYSIDVKVGKVTKIEITWGAMIGDINTMEDGEKLYREAAGLDSSITTGDYRAFHVLVYDKLFKTPFEWLKEVVIRPMVKDDLSKE